VSLIVAAVIVIWNIQRARHGDIPAIRRIPPLEAIDEVVGRATEMGRPVAMIPGCGDIVDNTAIETMAGLDILGYVASKTAEYNADLRVIVAKANVYPLALERVRSAYLAAGKADQFDPEKQVLFMSGDFFAYIMGAISLMQREKTAGAVMTGFFTGDTTLVAEGAALAGALTVAGLNRVTHVAYFVVQADYTLIGEELLVAGAYVSRDEIKLGSIRGQDHLKAIGVVVMVVGVLMATFSSATPILDLLKK
jgi:hypothetical protein